MSEEDGKCLAKKWLLIGAFQQVKSVFVFTDDRISYTQVLGSTPRKILLEEAASASCFDFEQALSHWGDF